MVGVLYGRFRDAASRNRTNLVHSRFHEGEAEPSVRKIKLPKGEEVWGSKATKPTTKTPLDVFGQAGTGFLAIEGPLYSPFRPTRFLSDFAP